MMATATAAPPRNRTWAQQVTDLLAALYDGLAPRGFVHVSCGRGAASNTFSWPPYAPWDVWPPPLRRELLYDPPDDVRLCPATLDEQGVRLRDTRVVWAEVPLPPRHDRIKGWIVDQSTETGAMEKIEAFPLAPSLIVDQAWSLFVGYLLTEPAALDSAATLRRVEAVQRALAERLGGVTEDVTTALPRSGAGDPRAETVPGWHPSRRALRVPASRNHDYGRRGEGGRVFLKHLDESRRYALDEIENALNERRG
jgi:hypothetical protein